MNNVIPFPVRKAIANQPTEYALIPRPPWADDDDDVALVRMTGTSFPEEGIFEGDFLNLKVRFSESEINKGSLLVVGRPNGTHFLSRIAYTGNTKVLRSLDPKSKDIPYDLDEIKIVGIVMDLNRRISLAA